MKNQAFQFDYYYGVEAEQFSFYRVPRLLIKDERFKKLSSDAKLLYGLMLDRMGLSMKNGWVDEDNRAYIIYTMDSIADDLGCSRATATKIVQELDSVRGIGLIEKKRLGLGKPDIIYVKNFTSITEENNDEKAENSSKHADVKIFDNKTSKSLTTGNQNILQQDIKDFDNKTSKNLISGRKDSLSLDVKNFDTNYTDINYTKKSYINPINQESEPDVQDGYDGMDHTAQYIELLKRNLDYDYYMSTDKRSQRELFEEIFNIICEVVCIPCASIKINGRDYPYELVKGRFLKLNGEHIEYVQSCLKTTSTKITNIRSYLITALYNAPSTMNHFYQQEVQHDLTQGGGFHEEIAY